MVPYVTLRLRLFPHLRWGFANYSIIRLKIDIYLMEPNSFPIATDKIKNFIYITVQAVSFGIVLADFCL